VGLEAIKGSFGDWCKKKSNFEINLQSTFSPSILLAILKLLISKSGNWRNSLQIAFNNQHGKMLLSCSKTSESTCKLTEGVEGEVSKLKIANYFLMLNTTYLYHLVALPMVPRV
jgi:hypothetical protein